MIGRRFSQTTLIYKQQLSKHHGGLFLQVVVPVPLFVQGQEGGRTGFDAGFGGYPAAVVDNRSVSQ